MGAAFAAPGARPGPDPGPASLPVADRVRAMTLRGVIRQA